MLMQAELPSHQNAEKEGKGEICVGSHPAPIWTKENWQKKHQIKPRKATYALQPARPLSNTTAQAAMLTA
jgi:hypothetical protein